MDNSRTRRLGTTGRTIGSTRFLLPNVSSPVGTPLRHAFPLPL